MKIKEADDDRDDLFGDGEDGFLSTEEDDVSVGMTSKDEEESVGVAASDIETDNEQEVSSVGSGMVTKEEAYQRLERKRMKEAGMHLENRPTVTGPKDNDENFMPMLQLALEMEDEEKVKALQELNENFPNSFKEWEKKREKGEEQMELVLAKEEDDEIEEISDDEGEEKTGIEEMDIENRCGFCGFKVKKKGMGGHWKGCTDLR